MSTKKYADLTGRRRARRLDPMTPRGQVRCSTRQLRRLLARAVVVSLALFAADAILVGWLIVHDFGPRAAQNRVFEFHRTAQRVATLLAREIAPSGAIDPFRIEQRRRELGALLARTLGSAPAVRSLRVVDPGGRVVLDIRRRPDGPFEILLGDHAFGGAAPPSPDTPPGGLRVAADARPAAARERGISVPMGSGGQLLVLGVSGDAIDREVAALRRGMLVRLAIVGLISLVMLAVMFFYVLRLVQRTRRLEAEAQQANQLAHLGTLASGLAHEIRNPLNAMNLNLQLLEEELASGELSSETLSMLRSSRSEVERLERLVKDFLAYARPRSSRKVETSLVELVAEVVRFQRPQFERGGVDLVLEQEKGVPRVLVDQSLVRQALINVLQNALEVSPRGERVVVRVGTTDHGDACVEVRDRGPGIEPADRERIFEVFYSNKPAGSGLGLPIAQRAVEGHGGRIEVDSTPGEGSTFRIVLPPAVTLDADFTAAVEGGRLSGEAGR
ncbi:MAG: hypothetical protein Kow0062_13640 [Acidobacteriota bacterium]